MYSIDLTASRLHQHSFLTELASLAHARFGFAAAQLTIATNQSLPAHWQPQATEIALTAGPAAGTGKVMVSGEGMMLAQLREIAGVLGRVNNISYFSLRNSNNQHAPLVAELYLANTPHESLTETLDSLAARLSVEVSFATRLPLLNQPGLLVMDMDSTVIAVECIDEIARRAGVGAQVAKVTEQAMRGELDFADSLVQRVGCLKGTPVSVLQAVRDALPLMPGLTQLLRVLQTHQWKIAIASGGFTYFADHLMQRLNLDVAVSNRLAIDDGQLTGGLTGDIVDARMKATTLTELARNWGIPHSQTVAIGDGANDLPMLATAGLGIAYRAKPVVRQKTQVNIRFGDLAGALWYFE